MDQGKFAAKYLNVRRPTFNRALHGHVNLRGIDAISAARYLGTDVDLWLVDDKKGRRLAAWEKYIKDFDQAKEQRKRGRKLGQNNPDNGAGPVSDDNKKLVEAGG